MSEPLELEQAALERLKAQALADGINVAVELFPDNGAEYNLVHPVGAILLRYDSSVDEEPTGRQFKAQMEIHVVVIAKNLRSADSVYELLAFVRKSLTGWMPEGFAGMYRRGEEFVGRENDLWQFGQRYVLETINHMGA